MARTPPDFEAEKAALRDRQRQHLAEVHAAKEAEDDQMVRSYWEQRAVADPDDPEVLRARADLIARDRGAANNGTAVEAAPAAVTGRAG